MLATGNIDIPKYMSVGVHEISFIRGFEYGMELAEKLVSNQSIAYNVEKVVEELEEEKYTREEKFQYDTRTQENMVCYNKGINRAIRVIRNGGKE